MSAYVFKAACRGYRPSQFAGYAGFQRHALISKLLKERAVARFVVAPDGYGKTCLAVDYAETVFAWKHVFFLNAQSPCFIRDLDDGGLADSVKQADAEAALVVFDDLPPLDSSRAGMLSGEIDTLLAGGCEVVVTCAPTCDVFAQLQRDRVHLGAYDMLLAEDEREATPAASAAPDPDKADAPALLAARIPALAWDEAPDAADRFAKKLLKEQVPTDLLTVMATMLLLGSGDAGVAGALGPADVEAFADLLECYPHVGYDRDQGTFETVRMAVEALAAALKRRIDDIVRFSGCGSREGLSFAWADLLLEEQRDVARACDVVRVLCPRTARHRWLADHARDLARSGCFFPTLAALSSLGSLKDVPSDARGTLSALEALCRQMLGDDRGAARCAKRVAFGEASRPGPRTVGLVVLMRSGAGSLAERAAESLDALVRQLEGRPAGSLGLWEQLALAWAARCRGPYELQETWTALRNANAPAAVLELAAAWFFGLAGEDGAELAGIAGDGMQRFVRDRLEAAVAAAEPPDFLTASAALAMEQAHVRGMAYCHGPLPTACLLALRHVELAVLAQRRQFEAAEASERARQADWAKTHPATIGGYAGLALQGAPQRSVPVLTLRLFGRLDASVGDNPVDPDLLRRKGVRLLLALLAINQGREVSRDSFCDMMWPRSSETVQRKNFYSVWSKLKRGLSLSDGTCPYLVRHQYGCSLEERHVRSDVARFNEICRQLLFGMPNLQEWSSLYSEIDRDFSNDFMPTEPDNDLIASARAEYRARLVDSLVGAAGRIVGAGTPQWGIWFARAAISRDRTREDAYVALMRAQIAGDQRTAAIMTYLTCRRVLTEELGVDPSPETTELYSRLIDSA